MSLHAGMDTALTLSSGTGLPGGANGALQYNANGIFGGVTGLSVTNNVPVVTPSVATPSGGNATAVLLFGTTTAFGIYYGSGAPTVVGGTGSLYLNALGSTVASRLFVNSNGSTTWIAVTTLS